MTARAQRSSLPVDQATAGGQPVRASRPRLTLLNAARRTEPRLRTALPADAPAIHALLQNWVGEGKLLPRTLEQVHESIRDFVVVELEGGIVGCGALRMYSDSLAEVGALAISEHHQGLGLGRRVVEALKARAETLGIERVFALTTEEAFFHRLDFRGVSITAFPEKIARDCSSCARRPTCTEIAVLYENPLDSRPA